MLLPTPSPRGNSLRPLEMGEGNRECGKGAHFLKREGGIHSISTTALAFTHASQTELDGSSWSEFSRALAEIKRVSVTELLHVEATVGLAGPG